MTLKDSRFVVWVAVSLLCVVALATPVMPALGEACMHGVCAMGLSCHTNVCVRMQSTGQVCGMRHICDGGLSCVNSRCVYMAAQGAVCTNAHTVCGGGLSCERGVCTRLEDEGAPCEGIGSLCKDSLWCIGPVGIKRCKKPRYPGEPCDNRYNQCATGYFCVDAICRWATQSFRSPLYIAPPYHWSR